MSRGLSLVFALVLGAVACGPIEYTNTVTRGADTAVSEARAANAAKWSPYWWTRAVEYLKLARIEAASADFQAANRFGRLSEEAAVKARDEALRCAADPAPCSFEPPKDVDVPSTPKAKPANDGGLAPVDE